MSHIAIQSPSGKLIPLHSIEYIRFVDSQRQIDIIIASSPVQECLRYDTDEMYQSIKTAIQSMYNIVDISPSKFTGVLPSKIACTDLDDDTYIPAINDVVRVDGITYNAVQQHTGMSYTSKVSPCSSLCEMPLICNGDWNCDINKVIFKKVTQ